VKLHLINPPNYEGLIEKLELFNINNISELQTSIANISDEFLRFVKDLIVKGVTRNLAYNLPLYWFEHFLAAKTEDETFVDQYLHFKDQNIDSTPKEFIDRYNRIKRKS
jgi:putative GTP pyrophosphokinase